MGRRFERILPIQRHGVPGLLAQGFRLLLGSQFFLKSGQTLTNGAKLYL